MAGNLGPTVAGNGLTLRRVGVVVGASVARGGAWGCRTAPENMGFGREPLLSAMVGVVRSTETCL